MSDPKIISFIARSKRRKEVLFKLKEKSMSQPEIMKETGMYKAHTSRVLKELSDKNLIICRNPEDRMFKFYKITSLGKSVLEDVKKLFSLKN